ncbi:MAG: hypothetical protein ACTMUB_01570 [cyanobacterium endosymbiont of Rhopalodia musculus]|uniref:hypothetical protein n=1 Tax=cyanobacterium endosymbiont of Epithemia clementina EcSB TaxID=3034674 RepID=UPI00247FB3D8|nr:hypothetical protein [cyanobacterium endosymbiont of Epithemia clementina EcSB]WGT66944.1 hypothetical protein P3F56_06775 [cyanobacterium endosymbiont of Epithemia clementina EcSB]
MRLLVLFRLDGIACRTMRSYKCPACRLTRNLPLTPDYNYVRLDFYIPSIGWLSMVSNPDNVNESGSYSTRFFMELS